MAAASKVMSRLSSRLHSLSHTKQPSLLKPNLSASTRRVSLTSRLPVELGSLDSMMPLHSAVASSRLVSNLSIESMGWGLVPQGSGQVFLWTNNALRTSKNSMEVTLKSSDDKPEAGAEVEESIGFDKSIQELKELRSQLHNAADYCETTFLKNQEKSDVLESTKEYICKSVVTVIEHLGNVSANLEGLISQTNAFSEAELRIQCLKQRLLSCEHYAREFNLAKMQFSDNLPRLHSRYLSSTPTLERSSSEKPRDSESQIHSKMKDKHVPATHDDLPLFMYTDKLHPVQNLKTTTATVKGHNNVVTVLPVGDDLSVLTKVPNHTFHFQSTQKVGHHRRSLHGRDILWFIRRTKRTH